ncbi:MAG: hypothetical protein IJM90_03635 [Firmicutes bacterium]|nr:hypothetical protein [Bacillota bacterium]
MDTHISGFLCNKPECTHDSDQCNAYLGFCLKGIHVYDGFIYWIKIDRGPSLWRMKLDGSEHEKVLSLDIDISSISNYSFGIHRGFLYYYAIKEQMQNGQIVSAFFMIRYSLDDANNQGEVIYKEEYGHTSWSSVCFFRGKAYALIQHQGISSEEATPFDNLILIINLQDLAMEVIQGSKTEQMISILASDNELLVSSLYSYYNSFGTRINQYDFEKKEWLSGELFYLEDPFVFSGRELLKGYWAEFVAIPYLEPGMRVFDWDGNLLFQKVVRGPIQGIALDENGFLAIENIFIDEGPNAGNDIIIFELISMDGETSTVLAEMIE